MIANEEMERCTKNKKLIVMVTTLHKTPINVKDNADI
jgi:hypothetical protein